MIHVFINEFLCETHGIIHLSNIFI